MLGTRLENIDDGLEQVESDAAPDPRPQANDKNGDNVVPFRRRDK